MGLSESVNMGLVRRYLDWIYELLGGKEGPCSNYRYLMTTLLTIDFYWLVPDDDNRSDDGRALRNKFCADSLEIDHDFLYQPCTVLEMMAALAFKIETDIMYDPDMPDRTGEWFYDMLHNLDLYKFTDDIWNNNCKYATINIVTKMLDRDYDFDGFGGLYPLENAQEDQRNVEIWNQMTAFYYEKW